MIPMVSMQRQRMDKTPMKKSKTHWFCYNSNYYKGMNTGDESDELEQKKTRDFMSKYMANYGAHRKGMTPEEVAEYYTKWSDSLKYEQDLPPGIYNGPSIVADEIAEIYSDRREKIRVIDIACGTGLVGDELFHLGFKFIDGVDPSAGMLKHCKKKNIYRNLYREYCSCDKTLPIEDSVYDCLVISGGMGEGHIPSSGLFEMVRIVKPGGYIVIIMRREYLKYVPEYTDKLEPLMTKLEQEGKLEIVERKKVTNYSFNREGVMFKLRVKKGLFDEPSDTKKEKTDVKTDKTDMKKDSS